MGNELLAYICETKKIPKEVNRLFFDTVEQKRTWELIKLFSKKYKKPPSLDSLASFTKGFEDSSEVLPFIKRLKSTPFEEFYIEGRISEVATQLQFEKIIQSDLPSSGDQEEIKNFHNKIGGLIKTNDEVSRYRLTEDHLKAAMRRIAARPAYLQALNYITGAGGFYSPQLALIVAPPKGFKTGMLINIAAGYMKLGLNVLYVDLENSAEEILVRFVQHYYRATREEVFQGKYEAEMVKVFKQLKKFGGDVEIVGLQGKVDTVADVEAEINRATAQGFKPDVLILDYIDLLDEPTEKQTYEKIRKVYHRVKGLNKFYGMFTITVSQINRKGFANKSYDPSNLDSDFGKFMNADAAFVFEQPSDLENTPYYTITTMFQRVGKAGLSDMVYVDEDRQMIRDIEDSEAQELIKKASSEEPASKK